MQSSLLGGSTGSGGPTSRSLSLQRVTQVMNPAMSAEEALTLSPWEKFRKHRRIPWKLLTHLTILWLCWHQTQMYSSQVMPYFLDSKDALHGAFFGFDMPDGRVDAERSANSGLLVAEVAQQSAFRSAVASISSANLHFDRDSVDDYEPIECSGNSGTAPPCMAVPAGTNPGVRVQIGWNDPATRTPPVPSVPCGDASTCAFNIGQDLRTCTEGKEAKAASAGCLGDFAAFTEIQWKSFFQRIESMRLSWNLRDTDVRFLHLWSACRASNCSINWHMTAEFSFSSAGILQVVYSSTSSLAYDNGDSDTALDDRVNTVEAWEWCSIWLVEIVVAAVSLCLCIRAYRANLINTKALNRHPDSQPARRLAAKRAASRNWLALTILQNVCNIISGVRMMNPGKIVQGATDVDYVLAISVFLTFVNTTRYLELFPDFYVLINTLLGGLPSVLRFMIGCTPIYLGFATGKFCHGAQVQFPFCHLWGLLSCFSASAHPQSRACAVCLHGEMDSLQWGRSSSAQDQQTSVR